mmetsp:Transcript_16736/g.45915  ORF Transcript_16736/g.45915 Transcript_16736/m.45915 type:complete len:936 (-) Transcript_16736:389-3196(-)
MKSRRLAASARKNGTRHLIGKEIVTTTTKLNNNNHNHNDHHNRNRNHNHNHTLELRNGTAKPIADEKTGLIPISSHGRIPSQRFPSRAAKSDPRMLQRKMPPNSNTSIEESKKAILELRHRMEDEKEKKKQMVFEAEYGRAFAKKSTCSPQTISHSRHTPIGKTIPLQYKKSERNIGHRYHTVIVKSSLTILPTSDDAKLREDAKQVDVQLRSCNLSLMPYEYKILQEEFASILYRLPTHHRYDPVIHDYVSQILDMPPKGVQERLEAPLRFRAVSAFAGSEKRGVAPNTAATPTAATPTATPTATALTTTTTMTTTTANGPDETNTDYVSIMKSFRDFCPQCKTFDCHFHITAYPDAATQASVAIQYDKKALFQQSRWIRHTHEKQNRATDRDACTNHSNSLHDDRTRLPSRGSSQVETDKSFWVEVDDKSTFNLGVENMDCPFCEFSCYDTEKLSKHMKRYHTDTFYFKESNHEIKATMRTQESDAMIPVREYFHANSFIPIERGHFDRDSDDESLYGWYHDYRKDLLQDLSDVSEKEKRIQSIWNIFLGCSPTAIPDRAMPDRCLQFIRKHSVDLWELEWEFYQLLITFWERHLLSVIHVENFLRLYHRQRGTTKVGTKKTDPPLTFRKRVICSRLHLMFQSYERGSMQRLLTAIGRRDFATRDMVATPVLTTDLNWGKMNRRRKINEVTRMRAKDISRPFFFPCFHSGSCTKGNNCSCIEYNCLCTKHCVWGEYGVNFFQGCFCSGDCSVAKLCTCRDMNRECDPDVCMCCAGKHGSKRRCTNMDVSLAKRVPLLIGISSVKGAGLGLFTKSALKKGEYIDEYIGEFIKRDHEVNRSQEYYFDHSDDYVIDATYQGNKTRFLNHSQTPNIEAKHRFVNGEKRVAFYAKQDIPAQTELFYSYGKSYNKIWRSKGLPHLCVDSDDDGYEQRSL